MNDERVKQAYERMSPDANTEERILNGILMKGRSQMENRFASQPVRSNRWAMIPAALALIVVIALGVFVVGRFDQNNQSMNSADQKDQCGEVQADEEQTSKPNVEPKHEPETLPEFGDDQISNDNFHEGKITVYPIPQVDINNIENCTLSVSVLSVTDSIYGREIEVEVLTMDTYVAEDISKLQVGDTIVIGSQPIEISALDYYESILDEVAGRQVELPCVDINGGFMDGGYTLRAYGEGYYCEVGFGYEKTMQSIGVMDLPVSEDFVFTDYVNKGVVYSFEDLVYDESLRESGFTQHDTFIEVKNGVVTQLIRIVIPAG